MFNFLFITHLSLNDTIYYVGLYFAGILPISIPKHIALRVTCPVTSFRDWFPTLAGNIVKSI